MPPPVQTYTKAKRVRYANGTKGCESCERKYDLEDYFARTQASLESIISEHKRQLRSTQNALQAANATIRQLRMENAKLRLLQSENDKKMRRLRREKRDLSDEIEQQWEDYEDDEELIPDLKDKRSKRISCISFNHTRSPPKPRLKVCPVLNSSRNKCL